MVGARFAVTLGGYLVAHFGSRMQADTAAACLSAALRANPVTRSQACGVDVRSDQDMVCEVAPD